MTTRRSFLEHAAVAGTVAGLTPVQQLVASMEQLQVAAPRTALDTARMASNWIARSRIRTTAGVTWPADPLKPAEIDRTFYNGTAGIVLFLLELHHATKDPKVLAEAALGADDLIANLDSINNAGLYTGAAGVAHVIAETARATGDAKYKAAAARALKRVLEIKMLNSTDIMSGSAGIGLFLLASNEIDAAKWHGDRLIGEAESVDGALKWRVALPVALTYPNFSHGTSGVAYFLATLYERTKDKRYLDAALAGHRYLYSVAIKGAEDEATRQPRSLRVFHHEPGGEDLFYLSWCHGPVGTARLYQRLASAAGNDAFAESVHRYARAIVDFGAPEKRSAGYWNNISQCCGTAGIGEFFIALNRLRPTAGYADVVASAERDILSRATQEGDGLKWTQSEHRVRPLDLVAQTGFMQGAAGVGTFFLHADGMRTGRKPFIRLPDSPFNPA